MVGVALAQVGEFSFILAQQGQDSGLLQGDPYQVFLAVSVLSMIVTPFLMQWSPSVARRVEAVQRLRHWLPSWTEAHVLQVEGKHIRLKDHVIIVGYGLNGRNLARVFRITSYNVCYTKLLRLPARSIQPLAMSFRSGQPSMTRIV